MSSLTKRFNAPLPEWLFELKQAFFVKIWHSKLMQDCKSGDRKAMETLMIRYWPFVDEFPQIIRNHQLRIFAREFLRHPVGTLFLLNNIVKTLGEIKGDEKDHRSLWIDTSSALKISEDGLYSNQYLMNPDARFLVQDIIDKVGEPVNILGDKILSSTALLRLSAVEIVAEGISLYVGHVFKDLDKKAERWFLVHAHHPKGVISHEELVYRMAFALDGKVPEKDEVNKIIGEVVDLFIEAGNMPY